jgi:hypothetical protein
LAVVAAVVATNQQIHPPVVLRAVVLVVAVTMLLAVQVHLDKAMLVVRVLVALPIVVLAAAVLGKLVETGIQTVRVTAMAAQVSLLLLQEHLLLVAVAVAQVIIPVTQMLPV